MPSGRTHDRITLWSLPLVTGITFEQTQSSKLTLLVAGAFLFSGLMFGPDLDLHSVQYKRWGWVRWIWLPYQKLLRHRSLLSHGPIIGTTLRVLYLATWLGIFIGITTPVWCMQWKWQVLAQSAIASLTHHSTEWLALTLGLELGAMSHVVSDWSSSTYKRCKNQGGRMQPRGKMKKHKSPPRVSRRSKSAVAKNRQKY
ncbi:MAG: metal-binding protein [Chroococcidiopsidaceae cyanobacterium CP_BM_RX_35]|nr:metal-binding protein [Chroococcidiopsidaceae cyanobacterium CP_BM_RX_35]